MYQSKPAHFLFKTTNQPYRLGFRAFSRAWHQLTVGYLPAHCIGCVFPAHGTSCLFFSRLIAWFPAIGTIVVVICCNISFPVPVFRLLIGSWRYVLLLSTDLVLGQNSKHIRQTGFGVWVGLQTWRQEFASLQQRRKTRSRSNSPAARDLFWQGYPWDTS